MPVVIDKHLKMAEVKLFGAWSSSFSYRVMWALKLKGIDYEYIYEDISNKSALLLQYNPVHKKIPVFVHSGKPIVESMVILEYIEETWPQYPLLPKDPYQRSVSRFWATYVDEKSPIIFSIYKTTGVEQEKTIRDGLEFLKTIEHYAPFGEKPFFGGDVIGLADLTFGGIAHWLGAIEELVGIKLLTADKFPRLHAWTEKFKGVPVIKENLPDHNKLVDYFKHRKEKILALKQNKHN